MTREIISTDEAPAAIGTYAQAVRVDKTVYISGQIPLDPRSAALVAGDVRTQIERVFANLEAICTAAGGTLDQVAKFNVYLTDLDNFAAVNEVMQERLHAPYPARAAVQVAALPRGAEVEVDAILVLD